MQSEDTNLNVNVNAALQSQIADADAPCGLCTTADHRKRDCPFTQWAYKMGVCLRWHLHENKLRLSECKFGDKCGRSHPGVRSPRSDGSGGDAKRVAAAEKKANAKAKQKAKQEQKAQAKAAAAAAGGKA